MARRSLGVTSRRRIRRSAIGERNGFTLISVLIAAAILIVGVIAVARSNSAIIAAQTNSGMRSKSLEIARAYVEEVRARNPQGLTTEPALALDDEGKPSATGAYVRTLTVSEEEDNLLRVIVSVKDARGSEPVEIVTYIYKSIHNE
ncbi:MAG TPA: hypothetical protein VKZ41_01235 [Gemmatimonadales bacterium]|nr:hypothetical protein [Gemmatimonadales bacterium]